MNSQRIRLPNGNGVAIPHHMPATSNPLDLLAKLFVSQGCVDGFIYKHTDGKEYRLSHKDDKPALSIHQPDTIIL